SRRRHTRSYGDWSSDVCSSDLDRAARDAGGKPRRQADVSARKAKVPETEVQETQAQEGQVQEARVQETQVQEAQVQEAQVQEAQIGRASCRERVESAGGEDSEK